VPVKVVGLDENNYALRALEPAHVTLTVRGSRSLLLQTTPDDFQVTVDVSHAVEGTKVLPVSVSKPLGIEITDTQPLNVTVVLERMVTKEFELQVQAEGTPANGYKLGTPIVKPNNRVHVTLPKDLMEKVGFVGGKLSVDGEEETVNEKKLKVLVLDKNGKEIKEAQVNPSVIEVEVPITKPFKKLPLQIGFIGKLPDGLAISSFTPSVEQITIYGPQDELDKYEFYDGINIDLSKLTKSGSMELDIPPEDGIATVDPPKVTINYTIVPSETKVLPQQAVTLIGLSDGLKAKLAIPADGTLDVPIKGAPNVLAEVGSKDVQLIADLSGLGPGSHVVPLDVHLPRFVEQASDHPLSITVEITDGTSAAGSTDGAQPATGTPPGSNDGGSGSIGGSGDEAGSATGADGTNATPDATEQPSDTGSGSEGANQGTGSDSAASDSGSGG
jgi:YbbR domain-containing protein